MEKTQQVPVESSYADDVLAEEAKVDSSCGGNVEFNKLLQTLPCVKNWYGSTVLYQYQGFWCPEEAIQGTISFQNNFRARDGDIILASSPKCGSTWLKALMSLIANRSLYPDLKGSPLFSLGAQQAVPLFEFQIYRCGRSPDIESLPAPRIFSTHLPYLALPESLRESDCKIVYVWRDPLDMFISLWHFVHKFPGRNEEVEVLPLEECFKMFCQGIYGFGPLWDHILGFWKASLDRPDKVLFLKYEDMKEDTLPYVKRLADFMGFPFSPMEEEQGTIQDITQLCSFDKLKNLDVHKNGRHPGGVSNTAFFRKGVVGDWVNYLKPDMAERLMKIAREKLPFYQV